MIVIDTSAWIEYFLGSLRGRQVQGLMVVEKRLATPAIVLVELACKFFRDGVDFTTHVEYIRKNSEILGLDDVDILSIARNYAKMKVASGNKSSLSDAIIFTAAESYGAVVVTCDSDFQGLAGVRVIH
ncbi:PIN domain-containing protein [Candidatus Woesearchaeota archaeon]|nr:PIN domain-containing protein [Candidatus Woesearchaeota archaeon]